MKTLTRTMTAALAVAGAALWGNGAMGQGTVTVTFSKNSKIVKVGGAISGTHKTLPDSTWTVSGKMTGPGKGKITTTDTTFSGNAGTTPSDTVGDTFVEITYTKKGEKPMKGKAALTVVKIVLEHARAVRYFVRLPNGTTGVLVAISVKGIAKPPGLGNVSVISTPTGGLWRPKPATATLKNAGGTFSGSVVTRWSPKNATLDPVGILVSFSTVATYAGITSNTKISLIVNP